MIILEQKIRSIIRRLILEVYVYGDKDNWNISSDSDWPAPTRSPYPVALRSRTAVFIENEEEYYVSDDNSQTHGGFSHALKHAFEMEVSVVLDVANKIVKYVQSMEAKGYPLFLVSKRTGEITKGSGKTIKPGDVLNTLDWINDKLYDGVSLPGYYQDMYNMGKKIYDAYYANLISRVNNAINISNRNYTVPELIELLKTKPIVKFKASFRGKPPSVRILDISNSILYGETNDKKIATYFMQEKRPNKQTLKNILATVAPIRKNNTPSNTQITDEYSNFREVCIMVMQGNI